MVFPTQHERKSMWPIVIAVVWAIGILMSGLSPYDRLTWALEIGPCVIIAPLLFIGPRGGFTSLLYALILIHGLVLILGGAYSYARVPFGFWLQDVFALSRNPYDKIGHFMQGFVPAIAAREILLRWSTIRQGVLLSVAVLLSCLGISAAYEIAEWWAAISLGQGADEFLGTQGDMWDTQSDMLLCGIGAAVSLVLLSRSHNRLLKGTLRKH
ncbi:MAG: DUF2238 domain-containing protein [Pseudomonadota bacterium]